VSEMRTVENAEESKHPVFEWQLMPALQGCLTSAMTELVLHFDSETITEEVVCQVVGQYESSLPLLLPPPSCEALAAPPLTNGIKVWWAAQAS